LSRSATRLAIVLLPEPEGPSIATTMRLGVVSAKK
jgi:hypothetical protein